MALPIALYGGETAGTSSNGLLPSTTRLAGLDAQTVKNAHLGDVTAVNSARLSHTYAAEAYPIKATVIDDDGLNFLATATLSASSSAQGQVTISVTPANGAAGRTHGSAETVYPGATRSFFSTVAGSSNLLVNWTSSCGSPSSVTGATYLDWTAPNKAGSCTIAATSQADNTQTASSTVTVLPDAVDVKIMPFYLVLYQNQWADLQSYVSGTSTAYADVTWSVIGPSRGTVNGSMNDRDLAWSSAVAGTYSITATSTRDKTKSGSAMIVVTNNAMPSVTANGTQPVDCTCVGSGRCVDIGGNRSAYNTIASWFSAGNILASGDTLRVWNKSSAYHEQLIIDGIYSKTQPVRVCGVRDANGNLPEINGANATAANPNNSAWGPTQYGMQQYAIWNIRNTNYYSAPPQYIVIEGLKVTQAQARDKYVLRNTSTSYYFGTTSSTTPSHGTACIRIQSGEDVVIRGNELANCGQWGLFTNAQVPEGRMVRRVTVEGNYLHDNSTPGVFTLHNAYIQSDGAVIQFNYFGHAVPGATGSNLKTRSAGIYVRYNHLLAEQRITDFVEPQDSGPYFFTYIWNGQKSPDPRDQATLASIAATEEHLWNVYDYGNTLWTGNGYCQNCVHYGWDMVPAQAQGGTLWFYHNSFQAAFSAYPGGPYGWTLWDEGNPSGQSTLPITFSHAQIINNVIYRNPAPPHGSPTFFEWATRTEAIGSLGKNWVDTNWGAGNKSPGFGNDCKATTTSATWQNSSGLCNLANVEPSHLVQTGAPPFDANSYAPSGNSGVIGRAAGLPAQIATLPPKFVFYPATRKIVVRTTVTDLGAIPYTVGP